MSSYIKALFVYIIEVILYPFEYVVYGIGSGLGSGLQGLFYGLFSMVETTYKSTVNAFGTFGVLAPVIATFVWGVSLVIIVFFILMALHLVWQSVADDTGD